jgi:large subunit ribosomal protein L21
MFAVIRTGGKQYVVKEGDVVAVEKLGLEAGQRVLFDQVLLLDDGAETRIGTPVVSGAVVQAEVLEAFKDDKILVFKKKRRKQFRRTRGHRQPMTRVKIAKIYPDRAAMPAETPTVEAAKPEPAPEAPAPVAPAQHRPKVKPAAKAPAPKPAAKPKAEKRKAVKPRAEKPKAEKAKAKPPAKPKAAKAKK